MFAVKKRRVDRRFLNPSIVLNVGFSSSMQIIVFVLEIFFVFRYLISSNVKNVNGCSSPLVLFCVFCFTTRKLLNELFYEKKREYNSTTLSKLQVVLVILKLKFKNQIRSHQKLLLFFLLLTIQ